jgi:hypothetical protein
MAASSNESFGLKIATSLSIALTVLLLVAVYFLNSSYNQEFEKNAAAQKKIGDLNNSLRDVTNQANEYRGFIGYPAIEDYETAKAAMKKDQDALRIEIKTIETEIAAAVDEVKKKIEAKGGGADAAQFDALKQRAREVVEQFTNNPDQSYKSMLDRLKNLTVNQAKLSTTIASNFIDLRRDLDSANVVNSQQKKVVEDALAAAKTDLDATIRKDEEERATLVKTTREQADALAAAEVALTNTRNDLAGKVETREKTIAGLNSSIRDLRARASLREDVLSKPGGRVTYVDYNANLVRVNVNRAQGVRPLMRFTIFDKAAPGITSDKPKAAIELTSVGDPQKGENDSIGRIVKTFDSNDPIRYNDFIYSVGWSYDHPQRFALVGKLDINRDGRDDRGDLIRMIEASGGVVEFDLPPPGVDRTPGQAAVARAFKRLGEPQPPSVGRSAGKISALAYAYVIDERRSLNVNAPKVIDVGKDDVAFHEEESLATKEARDNSVRPLPLEKLLNLLGYDYSAPIEGRREAFDKFGVRQLLKPKGAGATPATPPSNPDTPKSDSDAMPN